MKTTYDTDEKVIARILEIMFDNNDTDAAQKQMWEWIKIGKINLKLFCKILSAIDNRAYDGPKM